MSASSVVFVLSGTVKKTALAVPLSTATNVHVCSLTYIKHTLHACADGVIDHIKESRISSTTMVKMCSEEDNDYSLSKTARNAYRVVIVLASAED